MSSGLQTFLAQRNVGQSMAKTHKPSSQTTRSVEAAVVRIKQEDRKNLRSSVWSTDVDSIANTTDSKFEDFDVPKSIVEQGPKQQDSEIHSDITDDYVGFHEDLRSEEDIRDGSLELGIRGSPRHTNSRYENESELLASRRILAPDSIKSEEVWRLAQRGYLKDKKLGINPHRRFPLHHASETPEPHERPGTDGPDLDVTETKGFERAGSVFGGSELCSERTRDSAFVPNETAAQSQKHDLDLDYPPAELQKKTFEELTNDDFDFDPQHSGPRFPEDIAHKTLMERIQHLMSISSNPEEESQHLSEFFASLKIDEYEDVGEEIIAQLQRISCQLKDIRRQKRKVAASFENEVRKRHDAVSERSDMIDNDLERLRKHGQSVIRGSR